MVWFNILSSVLSGGVRPLISELSSASFTLSFTPHSSELAVLIAVQVHMSGSALYSQPQMPWWMLCCYSGVCQYTAHLRWNVSLAASQACIQVQGIVTRVCYILHVSDASRHYNFGEDSDTKKWERNNHSCLQPMTKCAWEWEIDFEK